MASEHEIIGEEWVLRAAELADWAMERLVNRKDVWGQYSVLTPSERRREGRSYKAMTLPIKDRRGADMVTIDKLTRHFASRHHRKPQLIGLHAKSADGMSKWFGIDIDMHDLDKSGAVDHARRNLNCAVAWWRKLQDLGYDPMLFDSNGAGGFHLWVLFEEPAPTTAVYAFVKSFVTTWREHNLDEEPETFPKKVRRDSIGSWFRLPGLHHTLHHYSRLWSGDDWLDDPWLDGHAAIDTMLAIRAGPPPPAVSLDADALGAPRETAPRARKAIKTAAETVRFDHRSRPRVCIDLDGVLAARLPGGGAGEIGPPIDGALKFAQELAEAADVVIHSSRFAGKSGRAKTRVREDVEAWLKANAIPFHAIHDGTGKPVADAYVDERAVPCRPEIDGVAAFETALGAVRKLCN